VTGVRETGHEISDVAALLVTHFHADHFGLAHKVREASGAWIGMHEEDARAVSRFTSAADFAAVEGAWLPHVQFACALRVSGWAILAAWLTTLRGTGPSTTR
jgi:glyoxylase-like metal-dependent hydrolase (beta-lactamase superfamily II)